MKLFKLFICFLCVFALVGCNKGNNDDNTNDENNNNGDDNQHNSQIAITSLDEVETWLKESIPTVLIDDDLEPLPTKYQDKNVTISWTSSNEKVLNNAGKIVKRNTKEISNVDLTYTITNEQNDTRTGTIPVKVYPRTFGYISSKFSIQIPERLAESIDYLNTDFSEFFTITWSSSDTDVITNEGIYIKPEVDTKVTIDYRITAADGMYKDYSIDVLVLCATDDEKIKMVSAWLENEIIPDLNISTDVELPTTHPDHGTDIVWTTSDETIMTTSGKVTRYVFDRYVELKCTITLDTRIINKTYWFKVKALDTSKMSDLEVLENFLSAIAVPSISQVYFTEYSNINKSFNTLKFFDNVWEEEIQYIAPITNSNRPGTKMSSVEFVVVHDTANNNKGAGGNAHGLYVTNGGGGTSFQYAVGNDGIYHLIPNDEVAYHAGDGTSSGFCLFDTGVKATVERPHVSIDANGYFAFNGVSGNIKIPSDATVNSQIVPSGLIVEVGPNGNYWLNRNYYNTSFEYISNKGGNLNSIGIETCVDQGSDYHKTLRFNEDLVARLLIENKLDVLRVIQHNNTAGKYCPAAMITESYWQNFRDAVSLEKFGMETFEGLTFEWFSNSEILSNDGYISLKTNDETSVSYQVVVKRGDEVIYTQEYTTQLIK